MQPGQPEIGKPGHLGPMLWRAAPDVFAALTPWQQGLRSPCFHNRTDGALRCLPYFSIIGASLYLGAALELPATHAGHTSLADPGSGHSAESAAYGACRRHISFEAS